MIRPVTLVLVLALSATGAWAGRYDDCDQRGDLDRAIRGCTPIIERGEQETPEDRVDAYTNRGDAYEKKGEYDLAIADLTEAIKLDPNYAQAYYHRGAAYEQNGDKEKAITNYHRTLKIDPSNENAKKALKRFGETP